MFFDFDLYSLSGNEENKLFDNFSNSGIEIEIPILNRPFNFSTLSQNNGTNFHQDYLKINQLTLTQIMTIP